MATPMTEFEKGKTYHNRIGEYTVLQLFGNGTMKVHCLYDDEKRIFVQRYAQMTIFNLNRGK